MKEKRGQLTIFVLVAIMIVAVVLVFFLWIKPTYITPPNAQFQLESCIQDVVEKESILLAKNAGLQEPDNTIQYNGDDIAYICYSETYYEECVNQNPFLKQTFEESLKQNIEEDVKRCYQDSLDLVERQGYSVTQSSADFTISLEPNKIVLMMESPTITNGESSETLLGSRIETNLPIYQITIFAMSIISDEQEFGDADMDAYNFLYPEFLTTKQKLSDGTTIYSLQDKDSKLKYMFASRSWAFPPGYGL